MIVTIRLFLEDMPFAYVPILHANYLYPDVVSPWNRTLVAFADKLSSTTVDFIRSEGELKKTALYKGSKRFYEHAQNLLRGVKKEGGNNKTQGAKGMLL